MPARSWGAALVVCSVAVGAPPLIVEPPLVADFDEWEAVHKSNRRGASPELLNHDPHAIDATPARWRGDAGSSPLDGARTAAPSLRNDLVKNYRVHPTHWLISTQI